MVRESKPEARAEHRAGAEEVVREAAAEREGVEREEVWRRGRGGDEGREGEGVRGVRVAEAAEHRERERVGQGEPRVEAGKRRGDGRSRRSGATWRWSAGAAARA